MAKVKGDVLKDPILRKIVEVIVKEIDPDKIILFGSRARGDYNEHSDYDILILKRGIKPEERRPLQRRIRETLFNHKIYGVDVIVQETDRFYELKDIPFKVYFMAYREGKIIYEKVEKRSRTMA